VSYPIKGTPYFDQVRDKLDAPLPWARSGDRDYVVRGRHDKRYYKLADEWLRSEVQAHRMEATDPAASQSLYAAARSARAAMLAWRG
jgi:hypothetical protein